jgi:hypothetical protein
MPMPRIWRRRALVGVSMLAGVLGLFAVSLIAIVLHALAPAPGEWSTRVRIGPWVRELSLPGLIRWGAHPLAAPLLDGRVLRTHLGHWQLQRSGHDIDAVCAPCSMRVASLGPAPLQFARAHLRASHEGAGRFAGALTLAENAQVATLNFTVQLDRRGADLKLVLPPTAMATVVQVLGHDLPEAAAVQVGGTLALTLRARWPEGTWQAKPVLRDFTVAGLGTERLLDAQLPPTCRASAGERAPLGGWLPRALIAAEDARFHEHPGYELDHMLAAWQHNQRDGSPLRGGSTLTQQLAKFTITGDDRSATRKLRELLYAVEMERTLGKARILQLYLALAPWGDGVCGAERAALAYLGKSAAKLGPVSAAWLVSLLRNPELHLQRATRDRAIDRDRIQQIVAGMRPMSPAQRTLANEQLVEWMPW